VHRLKKVSAECLPGDGLLLQIHLKKYFKMYSRPMGVWFQETTVEENLQMLRMHRVQCCAADAGFIFPIMPPTSTEDMLPLTNLKFSLYHLN
jgi:hypothetical protein